MYPYLIIADIGGNVLLLPEYPKQVHRCTKLVHGVTDRYSIFGVTELMTPCFRGSYCIVFNFDTEESRFAHAVDDMNSIHPIWQRMPQIKAALNRGTG